MNRTFFLLSNAYPDKKVCNIKVQTNIVIITNVTFQSTAQLEKKLVFKICCVNPHPFIKRDNRTAEFVSQETIKHIILYHKKIFSINPQSTKPCLYFNTLKKILVKWHLFNAQTFNIVFSCFSLPYVSMMFAQIVSLCNTRQIYLVPHTWPCE